MKQILFVNKIIRKPSLETQWQPDRCCKFNKNVFLFYIYCLQNELQSQIKSERNIITICGPDTVSPMKNRGNQSSVIGAQKRSFLWITRKDCQCFNEIRKKTLFQDTLSVGKKIKIELSRSMAGMGEAHWALRTTE